jgi:hypothetical protein
VGHSEIFVMDERRVTGNATLDGRWAEGGRRALDRDSSVAVAAFRRYPDAVHAREWTVAEGAAGTGVMVGTDLTVALVLLALLAAVGHQAVWPFGALGVGFGAVAGAALAVLMRRRTAGGVRIGRYELRVDAADADRVQAALLRAKGELGEVIVIPAAAAGRRAPAYPAGNPQASAEELLGLAAPARRG